MYRKIIALVDFYITNKNVVYCIYMYIVYRPSQVHVCVSDVLNLEAIKALKVVFSEIFFFLIRIPQSKVLLYWPSLSKLSHLRIELSCLCCGGGFLSLRLDVEFTWSAVTVSQCSTCWTCQQPWMKVFNTVLMQQFETPAAEKTLRDFWVSFCSCYLIKSVLCLV